MEHPFGAARADQKGHCCYGSRKMQHQQTSSIREALGIDPEGEPMDELWS